MADQAQETPESRLYSAGFTRQLEFWVTPDGERVLNLNDALAALDAGEIKPAGLEMPALADQPGFRELTAEAVDAMADRLFRQPPPAPPDLLEPLAELVVQKTETCGPRRGPFGAEGRGPPAGAGAAGVSARVLPGSRERAWHEAYHCAGLCIAGLVPRCARTDFPHDGAAGSVDIDWGEGGHRNPAAAKAVLVAIILGGTSEGRQGWEWDNWPIDPRHMAEGAVGDALMARELFDHFEMDRVD